MPQPHSTLPTLPSSQGELTRIKKDFDVVARGEREWREKHVAFAGNHQDCTKVIARLQDEVHGMQLRQQADIRLRWGRRRELQLIETSQQLLKRMEPLLALKVTTMRAPGEDKSGKAAGDMGCFVESVLASFPVELGVQQYDVVDEINGVVIKSKRDFLDCVATLKPGASIAIKTFRPSKR